MPRLFSSHLKGETMLTISLIIGVTLMLSELTRQVEKRAKLVVSLPRY